MMPSPKDYFPLVDYNRNTSKVHQHADCRDEQKRPLVWASTCLIAVGLFVTTVISALLLIADSRKWTLPENAYHVVSGNRASVQLVVQLLSNALALIWVTLFCTLISYASRIYFQDHSIDLYTLRLWHSLCSRTVNWSMPFELLIVILLFIGVTAIPSALWAGALTPVATTIQKDSRILLPAYRNTTNIVEWPSEIDKSGPSLRNSLGIFTYSVGVQLLGSLLASASSATPVDSSMRQHQKLDYTHYNYIGRSYGAGASVGLTDLALTSEELHLNYSYIEPGYQTTVLCEYNQTTDFRIEPDQGDMQYAATGELPNSTPDDPEYSVYLGHDTKAIVAIGVGRNSLSPVRMLGIAAGEYYKHLDKIQCTLEFHPTLFNVSVGIKTGSILVEPIDSTNGSVNFAPDNLTHVLTRQFELIANDQTNLYVSLVGNSLNNSIGDVITNYASSKNKSLTLAEATPLGLANSFSAMADDMLIAYASAQIMIADQTTPQQVQITSASVRVGERKYIYAIFGVNLGVMFLVIVEALRTRGWRNKGVFEIMDPAQLVNGAPASDTKNTVRSNDVVNTSTFKMGKARVELKAGRVVPFRRECS
ncbi:Hypothetical protein R9X50_00687200 [Acrodontium crateriforme]|uniref:Uncharacterized protein n=1 Tax=Acrodontium crateriforme TaxID=150365 RepID=A0AAQ3RDU5_9PEZI|nr:Hypothetical protein R9X50_00687200 [Acrodontium crateriforme]